MQKLGKIEDANSLKSRRQIMEALGEVRNPERAKLDVYTQVFAEQYKELENSPRAKMFGLTDDARIAFGECLSNYMLESNNLSNMGLNPLLALNVNTAVFGNPVLSVFTAEQALTDLQGVIYFQNVKAGTTRGNVTAGQYLAKGAGAKEVYPVGFAGEGVYGKVIGTGDGSNTTISGTLSTDIRPNYVNIQAGDVVATDDGKGNLFGTGVHGTVNYKTGAVSLTFGTAPASGVQVVANFANNFENTSLPEINVEYDSKIVKAGTFGLQADVSILSQFVSKNRLNIDAQKLVVKVLTEQILREIHNDAISKIAGVGSADPLKTTQFTLTPPNQGISIQDHLNTFGLTLAKVQAKMAKASGKGDFKAILAGSSFCENLTVINEFKQVGTVTDDPTLFGTLTGKYGNIQVIRCPQLAATDDSAAYAVYKGEEKTNAAAIYCPYMPVTIAEGIPVPDKMLQRRTAIAAMATTEVVVPNYIQRIALTGDPYAGTVVKTEEQSA